MSNPALDRIIATLRVAKDQQTFRKLDFFRPYPKQQVFLDAGAVYRERLLMAANRVGKSYTGAAETAFHATGEYPEDWYGRRFTKPVKIWAAGESSLVVRDVQQKLLFGEPGVDSALGSGMIPKEAIADKPTLARGVTDAFDSVQVRHKGPGGVEDGISIVRFKSYEQGRSKMQGEALDFFWCDEEPDEDIYTEILARIGDTKGCGILTFTPLKGMSKVVMRFLNEPSPDRSVITMTIDDAQHFTEAERVTVISGYPAWQREARARGIPLMGDGVVFPVPESAIRENTRSYIPDHWAKIWGVDFGIAHPFAAVLVAWDRDADTIHLLHAIRMSGVGATVTPMQHAAAIKAVAGNVPVAWPHDGNNREKGTGETLAAMYVKQGLRMRPQHATWPDGGNSVEAGILDMQDRMATNRFKVANHLGEWFEEFRLYHRDKGLIVKTNDDLLDATRIAIMDLRFAKSGPINAGAYARPRTDGMAKDVDFEMF